MRRWVVVLLLALALTLVLGRVVSTIYAEWAWHESLGTLAIYRSSLTHQLAWRVGAGGVAVLFAFLNLYALRKSIVSLVLPRRLGNIEIGEAVSARLLLTVVAIVAAVLGLLLSAPTGNWTTFALARIAEPFREMDPYLDRDLSFVMTWLPFENDLYEWAGRTMLVVSLLIIVLYALTPSLRLRRGGLYVSAWCRRHLATLAALGILLLAWRWRIEQLTLTSVPEGSLQMFGAYSQKVGLPLLGWLTLLTVVLAFVVFWSGWHNHGKLTAVAGLVACFGGPLAKVSLPILTSREASTAQQQDENRPYESTSLLFTRRAFGVDEIERQGTAPSNAPGGALAGTVPAWEPSALARTVAPVGAAASRTSIAWTAGGGALRAAVVSSDRPGSRGWGSAAFDPSVADERGRALPALSVEPGVASLQTWSDLLVFPGAQGPLIVDDSSGHVPAPAFSTALDRLMHAWHQRSPRLFGAESPARPRIVFTRDVAERLKELAPFLLVGPTVLPVVRGSSLYWVAELYTTSQFYPLTRQLIFAGELRSYVHHAATAFVEAATGKVTFVASASADALMRTWMRRFPGVFGAPGSVPSGLWSIRPPAADWGNLQATALGRAGMSERLAPVHLNVGTDNADADLVSSTPTFIAGDARNGSLRWTVPMVNNAGHVVGAVVRSTEGNGGTSWIAAAREDRWTDVLDRLQRAADSAGIGRQRRSPRRGHVLTVPTGEGLLYLQSHYEWPTDAAPVLTGVAGVRGGIARAGATIAEALGLPAAPGGAPGAFRSTVDALYRRMNDALRRGDMQAFGSAFNALGELLRGR
jgi:uncharacterized membrane protein (UPF0182 family)